MMADDDDLLLIGFGLHLIDGLPCKVSAGAQIDSFSMRIEEHSPVSSSSSSVTVVMTVMFVAAVMTTLMVTAAAPLSAVLVVMSSVVWRMILTGFAGE